MSDTRAAETAGKRFDAFKHDVLKRAADRIHSIYIIGSAVTDDFDPDRSDINSIVVLKKMDLDFLEMLAPMGKSYRKQKISAPLIMTPAYIDSSLDVFPMEFLNYGLFHETVFGPDLLEELAIGKKDLRAQLERELKARLVGLRQGYLSSEGDRKRLKEIFSRLVSGYLPLFRGIIYLGGQLPPGPGEKVVSMLQSETGIDMSVFYRMQDLKTGRGKIGPEMLIGIFRNCYDAVEKLTEKIDRIGLDR